MSRLKVPGLVIARWRRIQHAFVQLAGWVKGPANAIQPPDRTTAPVDPEEGRRHARARFWTELRAGQREAEARIARRLP